MYLYSHFEEKGYRFEAYVPDSDVDPVEFELRILVDGSPKASFSIPMTYRPVFGIDIDDLATLEMVADAIVKALPPAEGFDETTIRALLMIAGKHGAREWRAAPPPPPPGDRASSFDETHAAFLETITPLFASAEAAKLWLRTEREELGGLTPEQALRRGLGPEVFSLLGKPSSVPE